MLVDALPPESLTKTALRESLTPEQLAALPDPQGHGPWSRVEQLLAALVDRTGVLVWQNTQIHGGKRSSAPEPVARPGVEPTSSVRSVDSRGVTYLAELREARRARREGLPGGI